MNRRVALVGVAALGVLVTAVLAMRILGTGARASGTSGTLLEDAAWMRAAFEDRLSPQWLTSARKLEIRERTANLITQRDGLARRYSVSPSGSIQRRGGATLIAADPFDLRELDLSLVPKLVAAAQARTGLTIMRLVVGRDEEGLLLWRAEFAGAADVYFYADGTLVEDPNDP